MSASAVSSPTRAEIIAKKKADRLLQEEANALAARLAELNVGLLPRSPLDASLDRNLAEARDNTVRSNCLEEKEIDEMDYDEDDLIDTEFWMHGVDTPDDDNLNIELDQIFKKKNLITEVLNNRLGWKNAFDELEIKFRKRALLVHELKYAFKIKREELIRVTAIKSELEAAAGVFSGSIAAAEKRVSAAISIARQVTSKKCSCGTKCPSSCGCRKASVACSPECGCRCIDCQNYYTYPDGPDGDIKRSAAHSAATLRLKAAEEARAEKKRADHLARMESGL